MKNLLNLQNGKKIIYLSSSLLYEQCTNKLNINSNIVVNDLYTKIKERNEKQVLDNGGMILRLSNVYGPNMKNKQFFKMQ